ncbi:hypothetical protein TNCV_1252971 [Trichonephila clavipes]|nr:hypothetical protein TNCV_1252971 [Trichonephila clavipes]
MCFNPNVEAALKAQDCFLPVLKVIEAMGITIGQTARNCADTIDNASILRAEKTADANSKEARTLRRALKAAENDNYAPGITD